MSSFSFIAAYNIHWSIDFCCRVFMRFAPFGRVGTQAEMLLSRKSPFHQMATRFRSRSKHHAQKLKGDWHPVFPAAVTTRMRGLLMIDSSCGFIKLRQV